MVIVLKQNPDGKKLEELMKRLRGMGLDIHQSQGQHSMLLGLVGDTSAVDIDMLSAMDIIETVKRIQEPYKNANRKFHPKDTVMEVGGAKIGGGNFAVIAGRLSLAPPHTPSRAFEATASSFCWRLKKKPACRLSLKSWTCPSYTFLMRWMSSRWVRGTCRILKCSKN